MTRKFFLPEDIAPEETGTAEAVTFNRDAGVLPENVLAKSFLLAIALSKATGGGVTVEIPCGANTDCTRVVVAWTIPWEENVAK